MSIKNNPVIIEIEGKRFEINPESMTNPQPDGEISGLYHINIDDRQFDIKVLAFDLTKGQSTISINGQIKEISIIREIDAMIEKMGLNASHAKKHSRMAAPMPGLVTSIKIIPGQHVEKGTPMMILEAMKMENVIAAPHEANIKKILVEVGQAVERGLPLIEFD